jgi:dihydroorotase
MIRTRHDGRIFDFVVYGGDVMDPTTGRLARCDVGVVGERIVDLSPELPSHLAAEVVDARGCVIIPGLVDLHTHLYFSGTYWGVDPRPLAWRTGVTSWVDCGSAGAYNIVALRQLCLTLAPLRTWAFLNISAMGLVAETGEARREELCDADLCAATVEENRDFIVGVKCRLDRFAAGEMGLLPLRRAIQAARAVGVPVMVHIGAGPPDIDDVLDLLRQGDIVTHCTTGQSMSIVEGAGKLRPSAVRAHDRGVLFDVGHGSGGFSFTVAESMLAAGLLPDIISSDLHQRSVLGPGFDLPTCMSKFLALGMSLAEVVRAVTVNPASAARGGVEAGALQVGRRADFALFEIEAGDFVLFDTYLERRRVDHLLVNRATFARWRAAASDASHPGSALGGADEPPASPPAPERTGASATMGDLAHRAERLRPPCHGRAAQLDKQV